MSTTFADAADENPDPNDDFTIVDEEVTIIAEDGYVHVEDITDSDGDEVIIFDAADLDGNEIHGFDARDGEGHEMIGIEVVDSEGNTETITEYLD
jgi:hypothetical protein